MRFWLAVLFGTLTLATGAHAQAVQFMWSGGATHQSIEVKARLNSARTVRLAVSESADLSNPTFSNLAAATVGNDLIATFSITGLQPDTRYYYTVREANGTLNQPFGSFRTYPQPGCQDPYDFTVAIGSDAALASNALVFETIQNAEPDLFLHVGDMHSSDIASDNITEYWAAYRTSLTRPLQESLVRNVSSVYVWDDRDFGPNDADSTHIGREAAKQAYLDYVPSHPLSSGNPEYGIYRAFTLGRARVIVTDARYHRSPKSNPDGPGKTMLGAVQKAWLKQQLTVANDLYPLVIWVNPVPWIGAPTADSDRWDGYASERQEIAEHIADIGIASKLIMIAGDAHMVAADDGSYSGYATTGSKAGFTVVHAAALDRPGNYKGGPYRLGAHPSSMQFGLLTMTDDCADRIEVEFSAFNSANQPVVSSADYLIDSPVAFSHNYFSGGDRLLGRGSVWRYRDDGDFPGVGWTTPNYIDTGWSSGPAQLGYGDTPDGHAETDVDTEISFGFQPQFKHLAYYFRSYFEVTDRTDVKRLISNVVLDDGAIIYVNGFEAARINMPAGLVDEDTPANATVEGPEEALFRTVDLSSALGSLFNGTNVVAVEVHQASQSSPDLSFDLELFAVTSEQAANLKPVADISASPATGDVPLEVNFDGSESFDADGTIVSYAWDFGDGATSAQPVVAHTYDTTGTFEATLTVTDNLGRIDVATFEIIATNAPPEAVVLAEPMTGETPLQVSFDGSLSSDPNGTIDTYTWSFGNGETGTGVNTTHTYEMPGDYWARLTVTDNLGATGEDSLLLQIAQGNLPPFPAGPLTLAIPEDTGEVAISLADYFDDDRDSTAMLNYTVLSASNQSLFTSLIVDTGGAGNVLLETAPDSTGSSEFVIEVVDTGGLSLVDTLRLNILPVNDPPVFSTSPDTAITTDAGEVSIPGWVTAVSPGPPDESGQSVNFTIGTSNPDLFISGPDLSPDGTLTIEPAPDTSGLAEIQIKLKDDGGVARGGVDSSQTVTARIRTNYRPTASFEFVRQGYQSLTVLFDASASADRDGSIEAYVWDFGDGSEPGVGREIGHTFHEAVPTDVTLTVTDNFGATASTGSSVPVSSEAEELPDRYEVGQFYPNPAGSQASIEIALPDARRARIDLVDVAGRIVRRDQFDGRPGRHRRQLDVSNLPSGLYLARVSAGDETVFRRMMVLR